MKNPTIEAILGRRSVRSYLDKPIPEVDLKKIIECGIYAPSARNRQSWHFTVITDKDTIDRMSELALEGMEKLGIVKDEGYHVFYHAPVVVVISSELEGYSELNCGCAMENMAIAAKALGIDSCIIGQTRYMFNQTNTADINLLLKIPEGYQHDCSICFGYLSGDYPEPKPRKEGVVDYIR
ncbi:MAG TPA: nitroreductase [Bacillota bacterium]|nr:nitroreductase [Bacillota bacterium]HPF42247.1 nitroreductase [Bacillota bacterium]HPJ85731.1 nitroreductase [Bacillota bacterium]HPQ61632.1 nitroreductase [Bacillota bacterium]HRX91539.1 nitroreductase [Candidatus Izemoplasmatales bacterium]